MVKVRLVEPFNGMLAAPNALMITGGATTVMLALAVGPAPSSAVVNWVELFFTPAVVLVRLTVKIQLLSVANVAPERETDDEPATAVIVPPPHDPDKPFGVLTTSPAGKLSVNPTPFSAEVKLLLVIVNVNDVTPFKGTVGPKNALVKDGGLMTVIDAVLLVAPVPLSVAEITAVVLLLVPSVVLVMFNEIVQLALTARAPADKLTLPDPAVAVAVPPQVLVSALGVATTIPAGNESVNVIPLRATVVFGLLTVNVRLVTAFVAILAAPKAFEIVGGHTTVIVTLCGVPLSSRAVPVGSPHVPLLV